MSTCWKCEGELPSGQVECEACAQGFGPGPTEDQEEKWSKEFKRDYLEVDWTKVKTLEDVIAILSAHSMPVFFAKDSPECEKLRRFLKPIDD